MDRPLWLLFAPDRRAAVALDDPTDACKGSIYRAFAAADGKPRGEATTHGRYGYARFGCRCDVCVEAQRAYKRAYRERTRARSTA